MLGRLIQGYGKGNPGLESATEEQHSRSLLWPQQLFEAGRSFPSSPPGTPIGSPTFRVGPFDDRGGLELSNSKDVRIIIAQDAFGNMDRPMVLFDSQRHDASGTRPPNSSAASSVSPGPRTHGNPQSPKVDPQHRNRSTTISGPPSTWSRPVKDVEGGDRVGQLLDCMFGVTSATKAESSTKMHVLLSGQDGGGGQPQPTPVSSHRPATARAPLSRARTSIHVSSTQRSLLSPKEDSSVLQDTVLVTRMFSVALPESKEQHTFDVPDNVEHPQEDLSSQPTTPSGVRATTPGKKPKLVEKKTPMFAIGLLFYLPQADSRINPTRPPSRASFASLSLPNSYSTDIASSWTLLEAIPESLASSRSQTKSTDRRVEFITNIWDVILRSLSHVEHVARGEIQELLQHVDREMMSSMFKAPKGPHEQRTNQRNVYIRNSSSLAHVALVDQTCRQILHRICYALRIPRVVTGVGFVDGHWLDETRYLVQICGSKKQHFFLFNLLTAFLGNHTEWLERLGPDWYKKQFHAQSKRHQSLNSLASRTVIVGDRRSISRRLIFVLASFLPNLYGTNALEKDVLQFRSPLQTPGLPTSSFSDNLQGQYSSRKSTRRSSRSQHVSFGATDAIGLSTSASSTGSAATSNVGPSGGSYHHSPSKDYDSVSLRTASMLPIGNAHGSLRKTSATNSAVTPNPATPVPFFSTTQNSYFPEGAVVETAESVASADLARILRRNSSSFAPSNGTNTAWGSLINNVGGFWARKNDVSGSSNPVTPSAGASNASRRPESSAPVAQPFRPPQNKLESMVSELASVHVAPPVHPADKALQGALSTDDFSAINSTIDPPRLRVDDKDGVVDVDVGIPGFFSWTGNDGPLSPPGLSHTSPSVKSFDGGGSIYSSKSFGATSGRGVSPDGLNVAGFLKRYHEDFSLQAVRPYDTLRDDIRQSMSREATPVADVPSHGSGMNLEDEADEWINVCSVLIADVRNYSIERLVLRRKKGSAPSGTDLSRSAGAIPTQKKPTQHGEDHFFVEPVMDFDTTLTDAIERILGDTNGHKHSSTSPTPAHARTTSSSTASTVRSTPPTTLFTPNSLDQSRKPHSLRQVVAGALEEVVKSVNDDLNKHHKGRDIQGNIALDIQATKEELKQENVLREGVKKWLLKVETRSVW